jgi:hypothetical protein
MHWIAIEHVARCGTIDPRAGICAARIRVTSCPKLFNHRITPQYLVHKTLLAQGLIERKLDHRFSRHGTEMKWGCSVSLHVSHIGTLQIATAVDYNQ